MTIKTILFLLFLYICLVWVGAAYLHPGPEFGDFGLKWTGIGLISAFALIVGGHLLTWWRQWRARPKRQKPPKAAPIVHEDDAALSVLIAEANAKLASAPDYQGQRSPIYGLPWRLLIGPEGSGKTSTLLNAGIEPKLLAGNAAETTGSGSGSTRLCNVWLGKSTIFIELSGKVFDGDLARWTQLLRVMSSTRPIPLWRRVLGSREKTVTLRGVIGFCDLREFTSASADPQRFERYCRNWQDRLRAIGDVFGVRFPVYQVITKCDGIPYFQEFFHQLAEPDTGQVLGCTLTFKQGGLVEPGEVFAEAESKRLTKAFRALYQSLAERRLSQLAYESNPAHRPAIYEFPRELKKIRGSIVQFLIDAFRPDPLRPGPMLRGYYFTAVREVEMAVSPSGTADWQTIAPRASHPADATQMFRPDTFVPSIGRDRPRRMARRWSFVSDLFHRVVLADLPLQNATPLDARFELYRRRVFAAVAGGCALLCVVFLVSWAGNRSLLNDVAVAAAPRVPRQGNPVTVAELRELDALRFQVERLRTGANWWLHLGLYSGNSILGGARAAYFQRFHELILGDLHVEMTNRLKALPVAPETGAPYEPVYRTLKTQLIVSEGTCPVDSVLVSEVLTEIRNEVDAIDGSEWQTLSDRQIRFYANELVYGNPSPQSADAAALAQGRAYLRSITGVDPIYKALLANARNALAKPNVLGDLAPNYTQVLRSQSETPSVFTVEGWNFIETASRDYKSALLGDCVFGGASPEAVDSKQETDLAPEIQRLFVRDYIESWQKYVDGFSIVPFSGPEDAARKLEILSSNRSPLLALFAMTANQTNFPEKAPGAIQKGVQSILKKVESATSTVSESKPIPEPAGTPAEISGFFQPVHSVVPPDSEIWVNAQNGPYMDALASLRTAMQNIASSPDPQARAAASQAARPIYDNGRDLVRQIARSFKPNGFDRVVQRLLLEPIELTRRFTEANVPGEITKEINGKLALLCRSFGGTFDRYPFRRSSTQDATLEEMSAWFAPKTGHLWKFQMESLAAFTELENSQWKAKDPSQKPQVTPEMLAFLNRGQVISSTFYQKGGAQPQLTYILRPKLDGNFNDSVVELEVDGQIHVFNSVFQKQFTWPAAPGTKPGAIGRIRTGNVAYAFVSRGGVWGVFRMMGDAEPRPPQTYLVEWKYSRVGEQRDPIQPGPVRMEFPEFPNGVDVFHGQFLDGLKCPAGAVR